jgi:hypothetical protein
MALDNESYEKAYKGENKPAKVRLDSRYGLCFRQCMLVFARETIKRKYRKKWPHLHIVMEAGHPNFGDAERIFLELKRDLIERFGCDILQTITKADKDSCGQLMMSDYVAHSTFLQEMNALRSGIPRDQASDKVPKGSVGITHIRSTPEALTEMRASAISEALARRTTKRAASAARARASKAQPS